MKEYKCEDCNKIFSQKCHFINHKNRKNKCNAIKEDNICKYCNKEFTKKSSLTRHIKNVCYKEKEIYKKLEELEKEKNKLEKQLNKKKKLDKKILDKQKSTNMKQIRLDKFIDSENDDKTSTDIKKYIEYLLYNEKCKPLKLHKKIKNKKFYK